MHCNTFVLKQQQWTDLFAAAVVYEPWDLSYSIQQPL